MQLNRTILPWLLFLLPGCMTTYHVVRFEVLEPAEITFPGEVRQLLVMDRLPLAHHLMDSVSMATLGRTDYRGLDTLVSYSIYRGLWDRLQQSPVKSHNWPAWDSERQSDILASKDVKLTKKEVSDLCWANASDAVVCLESVFLKIRLEDTVYVRRQGIRKPRYKGVLTSHWAIYLPDHPKPYRERTIKDSLEHWVGAGGMNVLDVVRRLSWNHGQHFGEQVTPVWKQTTRKIYSGSHRTLQDATMNTRKGNWDQAFNQWTQLAESGTRIERAKAMYNLAVYYEMEDRLDSAAALMVRASQLHEASLILEYKQEIERRLQNRESIQRQVDGGAIQDRLR